MPIDRFEMAATDAIETWLENHPDDKSLMDAIARENIDKTREWSDQNGFGPWSPFVARRSMTANLHEMYSLDHSREIGGIRNVVMMLAVEYVRWDEIAQTAIDRVLDAEEAGLGPEIGVDAFGQQEGNK